MGYSGHKYTITKSTNGGSVECSEKHTRATVQIIVDNTEIKARKVLHYYSRLTCPAYFDIVDKLGLDLTN